MERPLGDGQVQHPGEAEAPVVLPRQVIALQVPALALEDQPGGQNLPRQHLPPGARVAEGDAPPLVDGLAQSLKGLAVPAALAAPAAEPHLQPLVPLPPEEGGELPQGVPLLPGQGPEGGEELALLLLGEGGPLQHVALHQVNAPALALGGADGHPRGGEAVHIPVDGPDGDLQPLRQLSRRHPPVLQQEIYHLKKPFPRHAFTPS